MELRDTALLAGCFLSGTGSLVSFGLMCHYFANCDLIQVISVDWNNNNSNNSNNNSNNNKQQQFRISWKIRSFVVCFINVVMEIVCARMFTA